MHIPATSEAITKELLDTFTEQQIYQKLRDQVEWDFNRANLRLEINEETQPEQLRVIIQSKLEHCSSFEIKSLLYLIDLPEAIQANLLHADDYFNELAQTILYREFVKIYYKLRFS